MNRIALRINGCADDWTAERAIIASAVTDQKHLHEDGFTWNLSSSTRKDVRGVFVLLKFCKILVSARFCGVCARIFVL